MHTCNGASMSRCFISYKCYRHTMIFWNRKQESINIKKSNIYHQRRQWLYTIWNHTLTPNLIWETDTHCRWIPITNKYLIKTAKESKKFDVSPPWTNTITPSPKLDNPQIYNKKNQGITPFGPYIPLEKSQSLLLIEPNNQKIKNYYQGINPFKP